MTYTHQKRPYRAHAVQWTGDNYAKVEVLFLGADAYLSLHDRHHIIVRFPHRLDTLSPGWWVVVGENGEVKCYSDEVFSTKYEEMK